MSGSSFDEFAIGDDSLSPSAKKYNLRVNISEASLQFSDIFSEFSASSVKLWFSYSLFDFVVQTEQFDLENVFIVQSCSCLFRLRTTFQSLSRYLAEVSPLRIYLCSELRVLAYIDVPLSQLLANIDNNDLSKGFIPSCTFNESFQFHYPHDPSILNDSNVYVSINLDCLDFLAGDDCSSATSNCDYRKELVEINDVESVTVRLTNIELKAQESTKLAVSIGDCSGTFERMESIEWKWVKPYEQIEPVRNPMTHVFIQNADTGKVILQGNVPWPERMGTSEILISLFDLNNKSATASRCTAVVSANSASGIQSVHENKHVDACLPNVTRLPKNPLGTNSIAYMSQLSDDMRYQNSHKSFGCHTEYMNANSLLRYPNEQEWEKWREREEQEFEKKLAAKDAALEKKWGMRQKEQKEILALTKAEYLKLETRLKKALLDVEKRERALRRREEDFVVATKKKEEELKLIKDRTKDKYDHQLNMHKLKFKELEQKCNILEKSLASAEQRACYAEEQMNKLRNDYRKSNGGIVEAEYARLRAERAEIDTNLQRTIAELKKALCEKEAYKIQANRLSKDFENYKIQSVNKLKEELEKLKEQCIFQDGNLRSNNANGQFISLKRELEELKQEPLNQDAKKDFEGARNHSSTAPSGGGGGSAVASDGSNLSQSKELNRLLAWRKDMKSAGYDDDQPALIQLNRKIKFLERNSTLQR